LNATKKILITRPEGQSKNWINRLKELGMEPVSFPLIQIQPFCSHAIREAVGNISCYDWLLFTSANGVRAFMSWIHNNEILQNLASLPSIGTVGKATAAELVFYGYSAAIIPENFTAFDLANSLGNVEGARILFPGSTISRPILPNMLRMKGAAVDIVPIYETNKLNYKPEDVQTILKDINIITFASPSAVDAFFELAGNINNNAVYACIGPTTANTVSKYGKNPAIIAETHTTEGLTKAIINFLENNKIRQD
jgi:uroporphyrinogen-III synthase